jgi:translocation and assembly module TamB
MEGDDGDTFDIKSDQADIQVHGSLDAWAIAGTIQVGTRDLPEGSFRIDGSGNRDATRISVLEATMLGGTLDGELEYSWRGEKAWQGQVNVSTIDAGALFPEWPGRVSGRIRADGQTRPLAISAEFAEVNGMLRGEALEASGSVVFTDEMFVVNEFSATHGASIIKADGGLNELTGLAFDIEIADAGGYVAGTTGNVKASGALRLAQEQPFLSLALDAGEISYGNVVIGDLSVEDVRQQGQIAGMQVTVEDIQVGDRKFGGVTALLEATKDSQSLAITGTYRDSVLSLSMEGALADWSAPITAGWHGMLKTLEVTPDKQHVARLLSPAEIFVSSGRVEVAEACIGPNADEAVCAAVNWYATGAYDVSARFSRVPLDLVSLVADTDLSFDQVINGEAQWTVDPAVGPSGFGRLSMTPGRISSIERPQLTLATGEGVLSFRVADNTLLNATFGLPLPENGEINGSFRLHDLERFEDNGVSGGIVANVTEIAILSPLIPGIDRASGRLRVDISLTGSIGAPLLRGDLAIDDGSVAFDPLGLVLEDIDLTARMTETYRVDLDGDFRSGDGLGKLKATADYRTIEEPYLSVGFEGERLALVNVEDVRAVANPDFDITLTSETLSINGSIHIPEALLTPVNLTVPKVNESPDVVIIAGELPDLPEPDPVDGLQYSGSLDISLGDNVVVDLDVARASVEGKVTFDWRGDSVPYANGRYNIVGTVSAFGQVLDISSGSVRFPDVTADSPVIRVRAEREIYGNTQVKRAGLLVDGPVTRPNVDAYTQPATNEERALALLVTGSDFDFEQGVGAIDFGTYIAPRVFVSYGIGVFERDNIVSARFDLTRALGIKASSGDKETGVDLNYRFEN